VARAPGAAPAGAAYTHLNAAEVAFLEAAVDVLIPKDEVGPGGVESGVVVFIDRQLAGAFGRGARTYMQGPFREGTPMQGYQLPLTPAEVYRVAIAEMNAWCHANRGGKEFCALPAAEQDAVLREIDAGRLELPSVPARFFLALMLTNAVEGYFSDPIHGGNRGAGAWRMIGFPGAGGVYTRDMEPYRNRQYPADPKSIGDLV
jgi:gluconate 2-dehydrogenase gamma chain